MFSIRDAIKRIGRSVKSLESFTNERSTRSVINEPKHKEIRENIEVNNNFSREELIEYRPLVGQYQRKIFQDFLEPLNLKNLKTFDDNLPKYDVHKAKRNWQQRHSRSSTQILNNFLENRKSFNRMMKLIVELTPDRLRTIEANNHKILQNILDEQEDQRTRNAFPESTPKNSFHEVPPIPSPLTAESFQKYIYLLTHSNFYYKNSSSLKSGIIADILLFTHKVTNEKFKQYRSVHTYNYLIKYFGFDKNQSSFARELLLVMNKDGHRPNVDTINNLLRLCKIHSNIRSVSNTFDIISKYLRLSKSFDIEINLTTYNRIYDSINNIFLKEEFLNEINRISLAVSPHFLLRIIDDYMKTTKDTNEVINFVENELKYLNWRKDSKIRNKIIYHKALNSGESEESINSVWELVLQSENDEYTMKYFIEAVLKNDRIKNKFHVTWSIYTNLLNKVKITSNVPIVYAYLTRALLSSDYSTASQGLILRGLLLDATNSLFLPLEYQSFSNLKGKVIAQAENYKIFKRIVGLDINTLEAKIAYHNLHGNSPIPRLDEPFSTAEELWWNDFKKPPESTNHYFAYLNLQSTLARHGLKLEHNTTVPPGYITEYSHRQHKKISDSSTRDQLLRLNSGNENYVRSLLKTRGVLSTTS